MITLRVLLDTNDKEAIMRIMHGIKSRVAHQLNDKEDIVGTCIILHFIAGKVDNRQEIDVVDAKPDDYFWSASHIAIYVINALRAHPHVKRVLIQDDKTDNTSLFIDWESPVDIDGFKDIVEPLKL